MDRQGLYALPQPVLLCTEDGAHALHSLPGTGLGQHLQFNITIHCLLCRRHRLYRQGLYALPQPVLLRAKDSAHALHVFSPLELVACGSAAWSGDGARGENEGLATATRASA